MPQECFAVPHTIYIPIAHRAEKASESTYVLIEPLRWLRDCLEATDQRRSSERPKLKPSAVTPKNLVRIETSPAQFVRARRRRGCSGNMMATAPRLCVQSQFDDSYSHRSPRMRLECSAFCRRRRNWTSSLGRKPPTPPACRKTERRGDWHCSLRLPDRPSVLRGAGTIATRSIAFLPRQSLIKTQAHMMVADVACADEILCRQSPAAFRDPFRLRARTTADCQPLVGRGSTMLCCHDNLSSFRGLTRSVAGPYGDTHHVSSLTSGKRHNRHTTPRTADTQKGPTCHPSPTRLSTPRPSCARLRSRRCWAPRLLPSR